MDVDAFASQLLEESKRFLEKADARMADIGRNASLHAALLLAFASLEAHLNSMSEDFLVREDLSVLDRSTLAERDFVLEEGRWVLTERLRVYRIEDRVEYLHNTFSNATLDKSAPYWPQLKDGLRLRNRLTHPRQMEIITGDQVRRAILAVIDTLDALYLAVYKRPFPAKQRGANSTLDF